MILKNSTNQVTLKTDSLRNIDEDIVLENVGTGLGLNAGSLGGTLGTEFLRTDQTVTLQEPLYQDGKPTFVGTFSGIGTNYYPSFSTYTNTGFTVALTPNKLTITKAGKYFVHATQLITCTTSTYLYIQLNGVGKKSGYTTAESTYDIHTFAILDCQVGDYIQLYYHNGTVTSAWTGAHSAIQCFMIC